MWSLVRNALSSSSDSVPAKAPLKPATRSKSITKKRHMSNGNSKSDKKMPIWLWPFWLLAWPFVFAFNSFNKHFLSYIMGRVVRDDRRIYTVKFVWYGDSIYMHPMIWGSAILAALAHSTINPGWFLLVWLAALFVCFMTVMYNFDVIRTSIMGIGLVAFFALAYVATVEFAWNPLTAIRSHITALEPTVSSGFYVVSMYLFALLICAEVVWAWLFHRVELDESYVYEHRFLQGTTREPIFARGLKRETKDLLELLILGAADIQHRTKSGYKRFKNVPFASLWLGTAIDSLLDHRRRSEVDLQTSHDESDQAMVEHAMQDIDEGPDDAGDGADDGGDDGGDDGDF